jgi:hypothetical protein
MSLFLPSAENSKHALKKQVSVLPAFFRRADFTKRRGIGNKDMRFFCERAGEILGRRRFCSG